jgi:pyrroloquinoline quinone biosynthesis protein B
MKKKILYIPDIDKWHLWDKNIKEMVNIVDYALLDGTFYKDGELNRDMSEIPHPFVKESMNLFLDLSKQNKQKVYFTHLNHTNPLLIQNSNEQLEVKKLGFNFAQDNLILEL